MTIFDLVFVGPGGWMDTLTFEHQPMTKDMAEMRSLRLEKYAIQFFGNEYCVYDLRTLKRLIQRSATWTIGRPVFVTADEDAAITWAMLNV